MEPTYSSSIPTNTPVAPDIHTKETARFIQRVYGWMSLGLIVTAAVAFFTASTPALVDFIFSNTWVFYGLIIGELVAVGYLAARISKVQPGTATVLFLLYAALNGLTFSAIFLAFTIASIGLTFGITAGMFGIMCLYGYFTKTDLTRVGNMALMALVGLILSSPANLYFQNPTTDWIITYVGILIFVALTAADTQKIKNLNIIGNEDTGEDHKESIMGALTLYLDFINLFIKLLRIFGKRK